MEKLHTWQSATKKSRQGLPTNLGTFLPTQKTKKKEKDKGYRSWGIECEELIIITIDIKKRNFPAQLSLKQLVTAFFEYKKAKL
jgi:hypothetical protein